MRRYAFLALCSMLAVPAAAQDRMAPPADDITVSARPLPPEDATRVQARAVAGNPTWDGVVPRVADPVCVGVAGMSRAAAISLGDRVGEIAASFGLERGKPGCTPTIYVLLVDNPGRDIVRLRRNKPWLFRGVTRYLLDTAVREPGRVRAWNITQLYTSSGLPISDPRWTYALQPDQPVTMSPVIGGSPSRLSAGVQGNIVASVVLIERSAVAGVSIDQLGAYVAMRGLAIARPAPDLAVPSILTLFNGAEQQAQGLTAFDRGFLQGLYLGIPNRIAFQRVGLMNRAIRQELRSEARGGLN